MSRVTEPTDTLAAEAVPPGWPAEVGLVGMSVAAAVGMGRLFADASFLPVVLLAVLASHGISAVCRRQGVGPLGTTAASAAGLVMFVTWVIEPHVSLVPSTATWQAAATDLEEAWGRFSEVVAPAKVTRGFLLGAVLGSWISSFVADLFAFRARTRVEAVVPSFTVFLFGALLGADQHRLSAAVLYLAAVLVFVVLAEVSAAPRPRPWLAGRRGAGEAALVRSGFGIAALALVLAAVVGPNLPGAYAKGVLDVGDGNGGKKGTRVTLSPLVDIRGRLVGQSNVELFTVATDAPTYWRITSLDRFDGTIWSSLSNYRPAGSRLPGVGRDANRGEAARSKQEFQITGLSSIWLPAAYRPEGLSPSGNVRFDPDSGSLATDKATSDGMRYTVESALPRLRAEDLGTVTGAVPFEVAERYLEVPKVSGLVTRTAQQVAGAEPSPYRKAKALQDWFRNSFRYNLQVAPGHDANAMDQFLASKQGYCEQFAGTYAAMARILGLPARVAVGFTEGTVEADGRYHVTGKEAHAWPEVYLNGYGWVAFEPTPGRGLPGAEDYTQVRPAQATNTTVVTVPEQAAPAPEQVEPEPELTQPATPAPVDERSTTARRTIVVGAVLALVVLYVAGVPLAKRRRMLRRRAGATTAADRVLVAWAEATEDMAAAGLRSRPDETAAEYAHRVCRAAGPAGPALVRLADDTSAAAWSAGGVAPEVATRAEREAAYVAAELRARAGWRDRLTWALDPRVLVRTTRGDEARAARGGGVGRAA